MITRVPFAVEVEESMRLEDLRPAPGSTQKRKRLGRGPGSGQRQDAGKGHKGQKARSGGGVRPGFEGGQMPLHRRLPKRGFTALRGQDEFAIVNVSDLADRFAAGSVVDPGRAGRERLIKKSGAGRGQGAGRRRRGARPHGARAQMSEARASRRSRPRAGASRSWPSRVAGPQVIEGLQSFQNIFQVPELKRRVLFTLGLLAVYRLGAHVPDARRRRRARSRSSSTRCRARCSGCSTCSRAAPSRG